MTIFSQLETMEMLSQIMHGTLV